MVVVFSVSEPATEALCGLALIDGLLDDAARAPPSAVDNRLYR